MKTSSQHAWHSISVTAVLVLLASAAASMAPSMVRAGQIFGQVRERGGSVQGATIEVHCGGQPASATVIDQFGYYQLFIPHQGPCELRMVQPGHPLPPVGVISYENPVRYNFEVVSDGGGRVLVRR